MKVLQLVLILTSFSLYSCKPTRSYFLKHHQELTPEQAKKLDSWTEASKENIWELSGQFEGDIVRDPEERNGVIKPTLRWSNREIPYTIDKDYYDDEQIEHIVKSLEEFNKTCIRPRLATLKDVDYVIIAGPKKGCSSKVGRKGGEQLINLYPNMVGTGCLKSGTIVHEFLHALGFYHMQSDSVRDNYVSIQWMNIKKGHENNFLKRDSSEVTNFNQPYDYGSVLHYSAYAFTTDTSQRTIITKDPNAVIGQRDGLSSIDIKKLNLMYGCK